MSSWPAREDLPPICAPACHIIVTVAREYAVQGPSIGKMSVRCDGESKAMEQLGEKQDFEAELSRLGFPHEAFMLYVRRASASPGADSWTTTYAVFVTNTVTKRRNVYWGGPGNRWVSDFAADVRTGLYGPPEMSRADFSAQRSPLRPKLVIARGRST
jgi:hypothetical protein